MALKMTTEIFKGRKVSRQIAGAFKVHPDFRKTRLGPYKRNSWTEFADKELIVWSGLENGLTMVNYDNWLTWSYEVFARNDDDNPIATRVFDLRSDNREINVVWAMSFEEKGFPVKRKKDMSNFRLRRASFVDKFGELCILEKELVADRFGRPALVQRRYSEENLIEIVTITSEAPLGDVLIMRMDNPNIPGYKQWDKNFVVGNTDDINSFLDIPRDISSFLFETRHLQASYVI